MNTAAQSCFANAFAPALARTISPTTLSRNERPAALTMAQRQHSDGDTLEVAPPPALVVPRNASSAPAGWVGRLRQEWDGSVREAHLCAIEVSSAEVAQCHKAAKAYVDVANRKWQHDPKHLVRLLPDLAVQQLAAAHVSYMLGPKVGAGVFSSVHVGVAQNGTLVAIKVVRHDTPGAQTPEAVLAEACAMACTSSYARPMDVLRVGDATCVVMPLMVGSVHSWASVRPNGRLTCDDKRRIVHSMMRQVAHDLAACHRLGIVHRDVKPANILYDRGGRVVLGDFGFARRGSQVRCEPGYSAGTARYRAPEAAINPLNGAFGPASDVWSLGCSYLEMFSTMTPFAEVSETQFHVTREVFARFGQYHALVTDGGGKFNPARLGHAPESLEDFDTAFKAVYAQDPTGCGFLVERMLNPDPTRRGSAAEVARAFRGPDGTVALRKTAGLLATWVPASENITMGFVRRCMSKLHALRQQARVIQGA